jgi:hypothetical protein
MSNFHIAERESARYWRFSALRRKYTGDYKKDYYSKREAKKHFKHWVSVQESDAPHEF